jgi:hypothetical protein
MEVVKIKQPGEDKIERLRKHRKLIRNRLVQLSAGAPWLDDFIAEVTLFPCAPFDDQVDAMTQYLSWITTNPKPQKRPPMAIIQEVDSQGRPIHPAANVQGTQAKGCVVLGRSQQTFNTPFRLPIVTVKY